MVSGAQGRERTLIDALARHAAATPENAAYIDEFGTLTYAGLWQATRRRAAWLAGQGVRAGETVALVVEADAVSARRDLELLYAVAYLGAVSLPVFPEVPQAACIALVDRFAVRWLVARGVPPRVGSAAGIDPGRFDAQQQAADAPRGDKPDGHAIYLFTSGTTGEPKALLPTHEQLSGNAAAAAAAIGLNAGDRQFAGIPWPSLVGMRYMLRAHAVGAAYVMAPMGETREAVGATMRRFGITRLYLSPWQLRRLLQSPAPSQPWPVLQSIQVTGAFLSPEEAAQIREHLSARLLVTYACNEIGSAAMLGADEAMPEPGCVGRPVAGMEVRVDGADGLPLAPGEKGELGFRSPWMFTGYASNPEATRARFRNGWFYPGDIGYIDAGGRLYLRGRQNDMINHGGLKIWPEDIESLIKQHADVADAVVIGIPEPMAGEVPVAFVVLRRSLALPALRAFCAAQVEPARIPLFFVKLEALPRNVNGKVLRERLSAAYVLTKDGLSPKL